MVRSLKCQPENLKKQVSIKWRALSLNSAQLVRAYLKLDAKGRRELVPGNQQIQIASIKYRVRT
jgi:hypothetical protein